MLYDLLQKVSFSFGAASELMSQDFSGRIYIAHFTVCDMNYLIELIVLIFGICIWQHSADIFASQFTSLVG